MLLLVVLENSRYLTVTLIERSSAGRFGPCFDVGSQQIEHEQVAYIHAGLMRVSSRAPTMY